MNRRAVVSLIVAVTCAALFAWIAANTYWADEELPGLRSGEALYNHDYAAERLLRLLGADAGHQGALAPLPGAGGVLLLTHWNWDLYSSRRQAIRSWVEAGGRLVVDRTLDAGDDFTIWSGISGEGTEAEKRSDAAAKEDQARCTELQLATGSVPSDPTAIIWRLCASQRNFRWRASRPVQMALASAAGYQLLRVAAGKGSVTAVNGATTFTTDELLDGDHARLLVIATQLRRGDVLRIVHGDDRESLPGWLWKIGAPLLLLLAAALILSMWRAMTRFGPLLPPPSAARRSLHSQVGGTADFLARHNGGAVLWGASSRALAIATANRYGFAIAQDGAALAGQFRKLGGEIPPLLEQALLRPDLRRTDTLARTLATLERARRRVQTPQPEHSPRRGPR